MEKAASLFLFWSPPRAGGETNHLPKLSTFSKKWFIRPPRKEHGSKSYRIVCRYYIKLRDDDRMLLEEVKKFFGVGTVFFQRDRRPNHHNGYRFEVGDAGSLMNVIIPFFQKHTLQSKRKVDFDLFVNIIEAVRRGSHRTTRGLDEIRELKAEMHQYRAR